MADDLGCFGACLDAFAAMKSERRRPSPGRGPGHALAVGSAPSERQHAASAPRWDASDGASGQRRELCRIAELSGKASGTVKPDRLPADQAIILDMDDQAESWTAWRTWEGEGYRNGHFGHVATIRFARSTSSAISERCSPPPRQRRSHSADGWRDLLEPVVERYRECNHVPLFPMGAAFASPGIYDGPRRPRAFPLTAAIRLANEPSVSAGSCKHRRSRSRDPLVVRRTMCGAITPGFSYQARVGRRKLGAAGQGGWHPGDLVSCRFHRHQPDRKFWRVVASFTITVGQRRQNNGKEGNRTPSNGRGCHAGSSATTSKIRLQLHALAYNLGTFMRTLALPKEVEHWSLTTLREKLVKIGAKVVRHGRYVTFQLARGCGAEDALRRDPAADRAVAATA